jgi:hypothetical protein
MNNKYATQYVLDTTIRKETQITLIVSNVSTTSIDGKNSTSGTCENLLGGVILSVHSSKEVDAVFGCWWSQMNYHKFGIF